MRILIAMTCALVAAGFAAFNVSPSLAANAVANWRFESPSEVSGVHAAIFLLTNALALAGGWALGWLAGYPFRSRNR
jgi:hypothetical protein